MPQSSPSHVRAPRVARSRAKVALILASVCALVTAVLVPLTSHLHAQAASNVPVTIPSLEGWTPASGSRRHHRHHRRHRHLLLQRRHPHDRSVSLHPRR